MNFLRCSPTYAETFSMIEPIQLTIGVTGFPGLCVLGRL